MTDTPTHSDLEDRLRSHYQVDAGRVRPRPLELDEVLRLAERASGGTRQSLQQPVEGLAPMIVERQIETARHWPRRHLITASAVAAAVVGIAVSGLVVVTREDDPTRQVAATQPGTVDGLVTEEVEAGVERIISDGAGHDLDEGHPDFHYDMDDVAIMPDGTIWLWSSYRGTDNDANPPGGLVWVLGESGETTTPLPSHYCYIPDSQLGVICFDPDEQVEVPYLGGVGINALATAPDGTVWAVGEHDGENGALYHITPDMATDAAPTPATVDTELDGLVTEEVEAGVERIISDGAGHDLDEGHPDFHYDMDDVAIMPDGTIWLWSSYRGTDNDANPPGGLVWVLGESGETTTPLPSHYCYIPDSQLGVICFDPDEQVEVPYLGGVGINALATAPDGTVWAVGGYDGEGGGLYHITPGFSTNAARPTT